MNSTIPYKNEQVIDVTHPINPFPHHQSPVRVYALPYLTETHLWRHLAVHTGNDKRKQT